MVEVLGEDSSRTRSKACTRFGGRFRPVPAAIARTANGGMLCPDCPLSLGTVKGRSIQKATDDERSRNVYENKRKLAKCPKMNATFCPTHRTFAKYGSFSHHWGLAGIFGLSTMGKLQRVGQRSILQCHCPISLPENDG